MHVCFWVDKSAVDSDETGSVHSAHPPFHPQFTYPVRLYQYLASLISPFAQIFGEEEKIYGYKDLKIDVRAALDCA
jgi:hypothetical protein